MVLIEGESETAFRQLSESLHKAFAPASARAARQDAGTSSGYLDAAGRALSEDAGSDFDEYENNLLDTMVLSAWRRMRAVGMETAAVTLQIKSNRDFAAQSATSPDAGTTTYQAFTTLLSNSPAFELVLRYEARHARAYERAAKALRDYRKGTGRDIHESRQTNPSPEPPPTANAPAIPEIDPNEPESATLAPAQRQNQPNEPGHATLAPTQHQNPRNEPEHHANPKPDAPAGRSARWLKRQARLARRRK